MAKLLSLFLLMSGAVLTASHSSYWFYKYLDDSFGQVKKSNDNNLKYIMDILKWGEYRFDKLENLIRTDDDHDQTTIGPHGETGGSESCSNDGDCAIHTATCAEGPSVCSKPENVCKCQDDDHGHNGGSATNDTCATDTDCENSCTELNHGVCSHPENVCHCHEEGKLDCQTDAECHTHCNNTIAICYTDHHCHCDGQ